MNLLEALEVLKRSPRGSGSTKHVFLGCGFTPLHLKTFLAAYLRRAFPDGGIEIDAGLFGDLIGSLERLTPSGHLGVCVAIEWPDLDPRLGIRSLASWRAKDVSDIVDSARGRGGRLLPLIQSLAERTPLYLSVPTLPLPPLFTTRSGHAHPAECELRRIAASLAASVSTCKWARVVNTQRLDEISPMAGRFDPKAEISTGFPYSLDHASKLAGLLASLVRDVPAKKGLITDLDDTLWSGILGESGLGGISWDTTKGAHLHGLYQRFLESLASMGILLAVASKNDFSLAGKALSRTDMLLAGERFFPLEINWRPKSASVSRILSQWNIAPDDVVFIDDSPMEVAEVRAAFPQMECIVFPKGDPLGLWDLLKRLRDLFGKAAVSAEDEIRLVSLRTAAEIRTSLHAEGPAADSFLRNAQAAISFSLKPDAQDRRAFELINKTNQFNLNGRRFSQSEWLSFLQDPSAFMLTAAYEDKYGPLGKVAVMMGKTDGTRLHVNAWVMSCRAFSRRIEHQCLRYLFDTTGMHEAVFDYAPTPRNGPLQEFLGELLGATPEPGLAIQKDSFDAKIPALFHRIAQVENV